MRPWAQWRTSNARPPAQLQVSARFKKTPPATLRGRADAGVELLRAEVGAALASFAEELKQKSI